MGSKHYISWSDNLLDKLELLNKSVVDRRQRKFVKQMNKHATLDIQITTKQARYIKTLYEFKDTTPKTPKPIKEDLLFGRHKRNFKRKSLICINCQAYMQPSKTTTYIEYICEDCGYRELKKR